MIQISGDYLEGGGSIVRVATALSAYTGKSCKINNIRANRPRPGLLTQHLEGIQALSELCNGKLIGAELGSTEIEFHPGNKLEEKIKINIPTAGSIALALQPILIASTKSKHEITIQVNGGATNGKFAASVNFLTHVLLPLLNKMNYKVEIEIKKYGYYPKGGGFVNMKISSSKIKEIIITERGEIKVIKGVSHASRELEKVKVSERQKEAAESLIKEKLGISAEIEVKYVDSSCVGSAIDLYVKTDNSYLGANSLGELGKKAEKVGKEAAESLIEALQDKSAVDEYVEDQLLPFIAVASTETGKESKISVPKLTTHTKTNIWVIEKFLPVKFDIKGKIISCRKF